MTRRDNFGELRAAAGAHGYDELAAHLDDPRVAAALGRIQKHRRGRWGPLLLVAAVAVLLVPSIYIGTTVVSSVRIGTTWARVVQPDPPADCSASNVVCETADSGTRLTITATSKIYDCQGHTFPGVKVTGNNITVQHCVFTQCPGWCVWLQADNVTFQDNDVSQVYYDTSVSDDMDALRFFGDGITIRQNEFHDILADREAGNEHSAHFDCAQNYDTPSVGGGSSNIVIERNYCTSPHFHQCLIGEGNLSTDGGGGGGGTSSNWLVENNWYDCPGAATGAGQAVKLDDIDNVTVRNNYFTGTADNAIYSTSLSTGVTVESNNVNAGSYSTFFQQD